MNTLVERRIGMDVKAMVDDVLAKVKGDDAFLAKFKEDPIKAVEGLIGKDLPDEQIKGVVEGLKGKLNLDKDGDGKLDIIENVTDKLALDKDGDGKIDLVENIGDKIGGLGDKLGGLFKKD